MSAKTQHETHPDAEVLSAFAEQSLEAKERGEVLEHLAVCGRCRQVVALARDASDAEVEVLQHENMRPRASWRRWSPALAPVAALAATAVIAIYVHERSLEKTAEFAKLERQQAIDKAPVLPQVPPQPSTHAVPPESPGAAPEKTKKTERTEKVERPEMKTWTAPVPKPDEMAAAPPPEVIKRLLPARGGPVLNPDLERQGINDEALAPTAAAPDDTMPTEAAASDEERRKGAEQESDARRQFAAKAPTSVNEHDSKSSAPGSGPAKSTEPADVSAQQVEIQPAPMAGSLQVHGLRSMMDAATGPYAFHLPSGLPVVSITSADHRILAVDEKGTLFIREDSGETWQKVKRQWTGRAIVVRRRANAVDTTGAVPGPETGENPATRGSLSHPDTVFELVNDQRQVWTSVDGRIWTEE